MTRRAAWALALAASDLAAYGIRLAWQRRWQRRTTRMRREDEAVTEESEESFPASDAPSHTPVTGPQVTADN